MASVNVPDQKVPQALFDLARSSDEDLKKMAIALIEYFEKDIFFQFQMWKRSGGSNDLISDITSSDAFENSFSSGEALEKLDFIAQIEDLIPVNPVGFNADIVRHNRVGVNGDFLDIRNRSTVDLDEYADHNDQIITTNGDGTPIKITSKTELRLSRRRGHSFTLQNEGSSIHWYMFVDGNEKFWRGS